jgi:hypothetical protein
MACKHCIVQRSFEAMLKLLNLVDVNHENRQKSMDSAAKNLCVVLELEFMAAEAVSRRKKPLLLYTEKRSERQSEQTDRAGRQGRKSQNRTKNPKQNIPDGSEYPRQRGGDGL